MAEIPVAIGVGWVVSPAINLIINKTQTYIENKFFKKAGIEEDMKKMKTVLKQILCVMGIVEKRKIVDSPQVQLVREIKDAIYDAEHIIDEFEYYVLAEKCEKQRKTVSVVASSSCRTCHQFTIRDKKFKKKVTKVRESLDQAQVSAKTLLQLMKVTVPENISTHEHQSLCVTNSLIRDKIIGREKECKFLVELLLTQSDVVSPQTSPTIIPIVGQGGVGKTTLAQMVFNDPRLNGHFDQKIWLTVSDKFDIVRLTREMLKCVCENYSTENVGFDMLQRKLERELEVKKILLILDDVWYNKSDTEKYGYKTEWLQLLAPLKKVNQGSKVILTTRDPIVKRTLGTGNSISLDGLSETDRWSLFELCAFDGENQHKRHELEPIGKKIVNKLMGLALAIKVVGAQLRGNSDVEEWTRTLNDNLLDTSDIMKILHRSYQHLPEYLKRCFAYCSLFPKDYRLKPNRLIHMWIAQGFVFSGGTNKLEDAGRSYFKELLARSFFQVIKRDNKDYYVMHDLMNDLASYVSKGECYVLHKGDSMRNLKSVRHLSITDPMAIEILKDMCGLDKLHTLVLLGKYICENDINNLLILMERIRVLDIEWELESFLNVGLCKHLRYLSFRIQAHMPLPDFLTELHHLTALFVRKLSRRYLYNREYFRVTLPRFLCNLSSLLLIYTSKSLCIDVGGQVQLKTLWRGGPARLHVKKKKKNYQLDLLEDMNHIEGTLEILGLENVTCREEAVHAQLNQKKNVTFLCLYWCENYRYKVDSNVHEVLETLSPNPELEQLEIHGYPGAAWPSWLESSLLSTITSIRLYKCKTIKKLPALGQLPLLQNLRIKGLIAVRRIGPEFYGNGIFPSLDNLKISRLTILEELSYPCDTLVFPRLHHLEIKNCPMFIGSELDGFPAPQYLTFSCPSRSIKNKTLFQRHISMTALTELEIEFCEGLITLEGFHEMISLQKLIINDCPDVLSLPEMELFYSLELLAIFNCPKLKSFPKKGLPVSLKILWIGGDVHRSLKDQIRSRKGDDWEKIAAIPGCHLYSSIDIRDDPGAYRFFHSESSIEDVVFWNVGLEKYKVNKDVHAEHST